MILLVGPPGSGKSTFCHQTVLSNIETRPVIYVTTESAPSKIMDSLKQKGLGDVLPLSLCFVDAFTETVGLQSAVRPDTVNASSEDLTGLGIAIFKLQKAIEKKFLLVFDSLTSPYLMTGSEILRFIRKTLLRFAAEGNAILACMDEGCGKQEDLVAMESTADGIVKIEPRDGSRTFNVIKHPKVGPTKIDVPMTWSPEISYRMDSKAYAQYMMMTMDFSAGKSLRTEVGDYVNLFWPNFVRWCGMLWDPKRFPTMTYNSGKDASSHVGDSLDSRLPWGAKLYGKLFMPKNFNTVKGMKTLINKFIRRFHEGDRSSTLEYLENISKTGEHYFRLDESAACWGFENVGATLGLGTPGAVAGIFKSMDKEHRDWNFVEAKCVGLGDPYCVDKVMPGEIDEMKDSLESLDNTILERIHNRLMDGFIGFVLRGEPLWKERPRLGNEVGLGQFWLMVVLPATASEQYRMAIRLGGAMGGKRVGERLMEAGIKEDEAAKRILSLLEYCKVGKVSMGETLRMVQNCESFMVKAEEPSCHFTTGFLNGFFSTVKNQHVKETKCIAMGDPHCEWEFR
jgi:predicted hydrocarbon binding protein/KaiC/GvpD/RAD55 family RecA-like ATPase